jgi:hypothetical protein
MKMYGECRYSSNVLDLNTTWKGVLSITLLPLYPRENRPQCPFYMRLGGSQSRSTRYGIEKISFSYQELNPGRPAGSIITVPTPACSLIVSQFILNKEAACFIETLMNIFRNAVIS